MCPKRNPVDMHRRRPSPSGMAIDELSSSELVALLSPPDYSPRNTTPKTTVASISLSTTFMLITLIATSLFAFTMGCAARVFILSSNLQFNNMRDVPTEEFHITNLPAPTILPGKEVPYTTYTSKHFQMPGSYTSNTLHIDRSTGTKKGKQQDEVTAASAGNVNASLFGLDSTSMNDHNHNTDASGEHLPAGQHLLVDFKDVDSVFLNSEERLAKAMVALTNESGLTLLSYHCHALVPIGVSCAGVLLESHVAFHTWPLEGVITMDLFTCGGGLLIPLLPLIKSLFGVPRVSVTGEDPQDIPEPTMLWSHKWRGFRHGYDPNTVDVDDTHHQYQCLDRWVLGKLDYDLKEPLVSTRTKFQAYDVYEVLHPEKRKTMSYQKSLQQDDSYESRNPELFGPDRILFLDGVSQSSRYGDASYHESIVHPALIAHDHPERVAIIGGGEGATVREAMKHSTVKKAVMIEIDDEIVGLSKEYLPGWSDCSDIVGSTPWCFDDVRAELRNEDAMAYFVDRYYDTDSKVEKFDVIIMDALDPNDGVEFATHLYTNNAYIQSLYNGLTESGLLVVQVGEVPTSNSPPDELGSFRNRALMLKQLEQVGFKSIHLYEEGHSGFMAPWATLIGFKDEATRNNWYRTSAEVDVEIKKRIRKSVSQKHLLRNFDGATMIGYQLVPKVFESLYCKQENTPAECSNRKITDRGEVYNPVAARSARSRHAVQRNLFGNTRSKMVPHSNADADNQTHTNQIPYVYGSEKWMDKAALLFRSRQSGSMCAV